MIAHIPYLGYMLGQLPHRCQQLIQNSLVPKSSSQKSFSSAQGKSVLYGSHFCLSYNRLPELLRTSAGLLSACGCGLSGDVLPKPCSLSDGQDHGKSHQGVGGVGHIELFSGTSVSRPHGTCIPTLNDLSCLCCSWKPPSRKL